MRALEWSGPVVACQPPRPPRPCHTNGGAASVNDTATQAHGALRHPPAQPHVPVRRKTFQSHRVREGGMHTHRGLVPPAQQPPGVYDLSIVPKSLPANPCGLRLLPGPFREGFEHTDPTQSATDSHSQALYVRVSELMSASFVPWGL